MSRGERPVAMGLAAAALLTANPRCPAAQTRGTAEVGVFARGTLFDPSLEVTTTLGVGARVAVFLAPRWLLEVDASTADADGLASFPQATYQPLHLRVNFVRPYSERGRMVAGLGVVATRFGGDLEKSDAGVAGLFGLRFELPRSFVGRVDGTLDYVPSPANGAGDNWNAGLQVGLGYRFGGRERRSTQLLSRRRS